MSYERLNITDFVDKWDVAKVQHLEDAIIKNEEDIAQCCNNIVQVDWEQSDENAQDYVKNRTHYRENKKIVIVEGFETEVCEEKYIEGDEEYSSIGLTNTNIPCELFLTTVEEVEALKVNINNQPIEATLQYHNGADTAFWLLENNMTINYSKGKENKGYWRIRLRDDAGIPIGQKLIINIETWQTQYIPLDEKYLPASVLEQLEEQLDWNCNESASAAYIKNRTHYDYWGKTKCIYDYDWWDGPTPPGLPYTFQVIREGDGWLGGHGFIYNDCLFNSASDWEYIGEEEDEALEIWKIKYRCQQTNNEEEILIMNAITYSQYNSEIQEYEYFVTIDCEYQGYGGIQLYEAEILSKTLDKRFLPEFSVIKNWSVNNKTDPRYIEDRTHYPYLGQGKELVFDEYDSDSYPDYNYLPYSQIMQSDLTQDDCSGYWLGKDAGYWINMGNPEAPQSYLIDAYSNWEQTDEEENNIIVYKHQFDVLESPCTLIVAVQPVEGSSNEYKVELRSATYNGEQHFGVRAAEKMYKTLDIEYLPKGLSQDVDWNENDQNSHSYIKNRPFYEKEATYETAFQQNIKKTPYKTHVALLGSASKYRIICNEETIETGITKSWRDESGDYSYQLISTPWVDIKTEYFAGEGSPTTFTTKGNFTVPYDITIQCLKPAIIKQLDEKFIPDTIARTTDVPSIDNTLTVEGAAADAKAVGEAISEAISEVSEATSEAISEVSEATSEAISEAISSIEIPVHSWDTLENKPFYKLSKIISKTPLFPTESFNINFNGKYSAKIGDLDGNEVKVPLFVFFDGKEYAFNEFQEYDDTGTWIYGIIGNASLYNNYYDNTEEPFAITLNYSEMTDSTNVDIYTNSEYANRTDVSLEIYKDITIETELKQLDDIYIPNTIARTTTTVLEDITEAPTAEQYNALLQVLRDAGILAIE